MKETFSEFIHNQRVKSGLTLTKLAAALDIDQSTLSKIENNKRPITEDLLPGLANIFAVPLKELQKEFYSEKIAEIICETDSASEVLTMAQQKVKYIKAKKSKQGNLNF